LCATRTASPANARQLLRPQARQSSSTRLEGGSRVYERLELRFGREVSKAYGADLTDAGAAGPEPRGLEVDDDVRRLLQDERGTGWVGERDEVAVPGETHVGVDHVRQQRAGQGDRCAAEREEMLRRLLGRDRPATLLHEFHEPVGRI
jgi:hypothetical protein